MGVEVRSVVLSLVFKLERHKHNSATKKAEVHMQKRGICTKAGRMQRLERCRNTHLAYSTELDNRA